MLVQPTLFDSFNGAAPEMTKVAAGSSHTLLLSKTGVAFGCGRNDEGQLALTLQAGSSHVPKPIPMETSLVDVAAGDKHTAFLAKDGRVFLSGSLPGTSFRDTPHALTALSP